MAKPKSTVLDGLTSDSWVNVLTGLGQLGKDKRESAYVVADLMSYDALAEFYRASDLAARIVDLPADDMLREGAEVRIPDDEENTEAIDDYLEERDVECKVIQALKWKRAFGGSIILIGANDGSADLSVPLNEKAIKSIDYLNVFDAYEARPIAWNENPASKGFGETTLFQLNPHVFGAGIPILQRVHASRCVVFQGPMANRRQVRLSGTGVNQGWGDSILVRCGKLIRDYDQAWGGVSNLLHDFSQAIYKVKGLGAALLADKDKSIKKRWHMINMARSIINAVMIDKDEEEFERQTTSISGVPETLVQFQARMSAAADMPVAKLFGVSPGGLGSSGSSEERSWYDAVRAKQKREVKPQLSRIAKLCMLAKDSPTKGVEPEGWNVKFNSLWQQTDTEKADVRLKNAQTDKYYFDMGAASTQDIAESRWGGDEYGMDLSIDLDALEAREAQTQEMADLTHEVTTANLAEHSQPTPPAPAKPPQVDATEGGFAVITDSVRLSRVYPTRAAAEKRLAQIVAFKAKK